MNLAQHPIGPDDIMKDRVPPSHPNEGEPPPEKWDPPAITKDGRRVATCATVGDGELICRNCGHRERFTNVTSLNAAIRCQTCGMPFIASVVNVPSVLPYAPRARRVIDWITWLRRACVAGITVCILEPMVVKAIDRHWDDGHILGAMFWGIVFAGTFGLTFLRSHARQ